MQRSHSSTRPGLILLVVLGMLALFSMLAVTYVVFASQSRATSVSLSRKDIRSTKTKPLFEEAIKELIRGTTNTGSSLYGHDLLGDVYGDAETLGMSAVTIRDFQLALSGPPTPMTDAIGGLQCHVAWRRFCRRYVHSRAFFADPYRSLKRFWAGGG